MWGTQTGKGDTGKGLRGVPAPVIAVLGFKPHAILPGALGLPWIAQAGSEGLASIPPESQGKPGGQSQLLNEPGGDRRKQLHSFSLSGCLFWEAPAWGGMAFPVAW